MKMSRRKLAGVLAGQLPSKSGSKTFAKSTAAYLLAERRVGELGSLLRDIEQIRADEGLVEVVAVSAFPLNAEAKKQVEAQIKQLYPAAKKIMITERIDSSQLGGVRLELANQQLDLSVRSKLNHFKQLTAA